MKRKLAPHQVRYIRKQYAKSKSNISIRDFAKMFHVDPAVIWNLLHRRTYREVT